MLPGQVAHPANGVEACLALEQGFELLLLLFA
jgi:hypothetical protein